MFRSVWLLYRKPYKQPIIHNDHGTTVVDPVEFGNFLTNFFSDKFRGEIDLGISAFIGEPRPLEHPITYTEAEHSMNHLNNNRASGSDELLGELPKCES